MKQCISKRVMNRSLVGHENGVIPLGAVFVVFCLPIADLIQHIVSIISGIFGVVDFFALKNDLR